MYPEHLPPGVWKNRPFASFNHLRAREALFLSKLINAIASHNRTRNKSAGSQGRRTCPEGKNHRSKGKKTMTRGI